MSLKDIYEKNAPPGFKKTVKKGKNSFLRLFRRRISEYELRRDLADLGIEQGDVIFVHSSMKRIGNVKDGPHTVIDALLEAVGPEGTVMMPAYSMPTHSQVATLEDYQGFDPLTTPATVGFLPDTFRKREGAVRSIHPTSSVCAMGKMAVEITCSHHLSPTTFGEGTPFHNFLKAGGKLVGIGIDIGPVTFYHIIEDVVSDFPVDVYYHKEYEVPVKDWSGRTSMMKVSPQDPEVSRTRIDHRPEGDWIRGFFTDLLVERKMISYGKFGETTAWTVKAEDLYQLQGELIKDAVTIYTTEEEYRRTHRAGEDS
jgi:aminoglycoside N3'-acetyltransferase